MCSAITALIQWTSPEWKSKHKIRENLKILLIMTLSWVLALHTAGHWHRIQVWCTYWRQSEVAVLLIGGRVGRRFWVGIQFLNFLLLRLMMLWHRKVVIVDDIGFAGVVRRPGKSRWYFLHEERKLQTLISIQQIVCLTANGRRCKEK